MHDDTKPTYAELEQRIRQLEAMVQAQSAPNLPDELNRMAAALSKAEFDAKQNDLLLQLFIKFSPIYAFLKDVNSIESKVLYASENFSEMIGISGSEMTGKNMFELFPADFAKKITEDDWAVVSSGEVLQQFEDLNGRNYTTYKYPITLNGRQFLAGYTVEITDLKQSEAKLIAQNQLLDRAIEQSTRQLKAQNIAYEEVNLEMQRINTILLEAKEKAEQNERSLHEAQALAHIGNWVLYYSDNKLTWSDEIYSIFGFSKENFTPDYELFLACIHPDDRAAVNTAFQLHLEQQIPYNIVHRIVLQNGQIKHVNERCKTTYDAQGKALRSNGTVADITERVYFENQLLKATEKAQQSEALLRSIINAIPDLLWLKDADGVYMQCNQRFESFFGATCYEINGKTDYDFMPKDLADFFRNNDRRAVEAGKPMSNEEEITFVSDGHREFLETIKTPLWGENGELIGVLGIGRDITLHKNAENELIAAKVRAEESDMLKSAFLQNMSHEIRTPLNAICGFTGLLNKQNLPENQRQNFISIIQQSSERLLAIVTDVLTISSLETKQEKIRIERMNLNQLMQELSVIFKQKADKSLIELNLKKELTDLQSEIYADKAKIQQIVQNLLLNSIKFTQHGSIELGYSICEKELQFYVKDTGIGIPNDLHERIFERFQQADSSPNRKYGGAGLGLAISKGLVELMGGHIWLESEVGRGATFYFTVPYSPVYASSEPTGLTADSKNRLLVLVAEDEDFNYMYLEQLLLDLGCEVIRAQNGREAVEMCAAIPEIALVLMDIKMPEMDGHTATKLIKSTNPKLPIIAQTAYALEHELLRFSGDFDAYLTKPISDKLLEMQIAQFFTLKGSV